MSNGSAPGDMGTATSRQSRNDDGVIGALWEGTVEEWDILRLAVDSYVTEIDQMTISNKALFNNLDDNYTENDPYILDIRSIADYEEAHIPSAVNVQLTDLFTEAELALLPTDREIVVYCDTGQIAAQVVALLNLNGFNAVSLEFGVCSWTDNTTIADGCYDKATDGNNFPVSTGNTPGDWATAVPAD
jgi:rhodanese-related sulfurtransferase